MKHFLRLISAHGWFLSVKLCLLVFMAAAWLLLTACSMFSSREVTVEKAYKIVTDNISREFLPDYLFTE